MPDTLDNILLFRILQQSQEGQATTQATLFRLERAVTWHDRKFAEAEQRFSHIEKRLNDIQAGVRDVADELEPIIKLEIGGIAGMVQAQVGHRLDTLKERIAALEQQGTLP